MRVLVTGASGFLGFHLCSRLAALGHQTTALHRQGSQTSLIESLGVRRMEGELADLAGLRQAVSGQDIVIHAAANIRTWPVRPELQTLANVDGSRNVAMACRQESVRRMIHVSSVSAIGYTGDPARPADEAFVFNLSGPAYHYHVSKKRAEEAVLEQVAAGLDAVIVNPATLFGPFGRVYRGGEFIRKVQHARIIPCFTGGRCVAHVSDVVEGILAAVAKGARGDRYILGGENMSFREMASRAAQALRAHPTLVTVPSWVLRAAMLAALAAGSVTGTMPAIAGHYSDDRFPYYSSAKARASLGYSPRGFDAIIADCLAWSPN